MSSTEISAIIHSDFDIHLNVWPQQNNLNASMTYPYGVTGFVSITQHRGQLSQIVKLFHVLDYSSRFVVLIIFFVTFIFFKFFLRQSVTPACMNLICNTAVPNLPNNVATRIYLSGLFMFMLTLQAIYEGKLASLLTKEEALPNVDTLEELANFDYTIYGYKELASLFKKFNYRGRFVPLEQFDCEEYVLKNAALSALRHGRMLLTQLLS